MGDMCQGTRPLGFCASLRAGGQEREGHDPISPEIGIVSPRSPPALALTDRPESFNFYVL